MLAEYIKKHPPVKNKVEKILHPEKTLYNATNNIFLRILMIYQPLE